MRTRYDIVINSIVSKLLSEGVSAENYNTNDALMMLNDCVSRIKLQTYLVNFEDEIKKRLTEYVANKANICDKINPELL